jgi:hypothetical protein
MSAEEALRLQHKFCDRLSAPRTAGMVLAGLAILRTRTRIARRLREWPDLTMEDAIALRLAGGLHNLYLTGDAPELEAIYNGELPDQATIDEIVVGLAEKFDSRLDQWLDRPPQTNEAGRSGAIMAGLLWLAGRVIPRFEMNEIGASAGVNTMMERYFFDLGGVLVGPANSPMRIVPEWRGIAPAASEIEITGICGSDITPLDLSDNDEALRLKSYVWPDMQERMQRIEAAVALAAERRPDLVEADAGEWVAQMLARPQEGGVTRVLYHSIMWQYMPRATRGRITEAMEEAGGNATAQRPLAWIQFETDVETFANQLRVRFWPDPDDQEWVTLAKAHPHGAWIEWLGT